LRRESDMMGFYVAIALLAALAADGLHSKPSEAEVLAVVWGTTVGLAIAHWFALLLSARLVQDPDSHHTAGEVLLSHLVMAFMVALLASAVIVATPTDLRRAAARIAVAVFVGVLVLVESRVSGAKTSRAVALGAAALCVAVVIAAVTLLLK
jgi:hypothetical protein